MILEVSEIEAAFILRMRQEQEANVEHKGPWEDWNRGTDYRMDLTLHNEMLHHANKLWNEAKRSDEKMDKDKVQELAADIGNFALKAFEQFGQPLTACA